MTFLILTTTRGGKCLIKADLIAAVVDIGLCTRVYENSSIVRYIDVNESVDEIISRLERLSYVNY